MASTSNQLRTATSIQRVDDIAVGGLVLGAGLLGVAGWLRLTPPSESP